MATKMNNRPIRPIPSRRTNFLESTPKVIYSQAAADFRPPADYQGPRKSIMQRLPDPSLNPKKLSLPLISVSKLDIQTAAPASSKISLPRVDAGCGSGTKLTYQCAQAKTILKSMPASFRKKFRSELKKKGPFKGSIKPYIHRDFHDHIPEQPNLNGIVLLGGSHRDMIEELPQEPGTPPPLSGRRHCNVQTDMYLEDIADNENGFVSTEMQCEPIYDEPLQGTKLNFEQEGLTSLGTQLDQWVFPDINHIYDQVSSNLGDAVIMESLKQLQEEFELEALRKQHEYHKCLRNRELTILAKYKEAQKKYNEQRKVLESRKPWDETLDQIIQLVGFDKIRDSAPLHFIGSQTNQAVFDHINETLVPPINAQTELLFKRKKNSRNLLDNIIEHTVLKREAEFAGRMYIRDPQKKGSLASDSARISAAEDEWLGEYDDDSRYYNEMYDNYGLLDEMQMVPGHDENEAMIADGEAWENTNEEDNVNLQPADDDDDNDDDADLD